VLTDCVITSAGTRALAEILDAIWARLIFIVDIDYNVLEWVARNSRSSLDCTTSQTLKCETVTFLTMPLKGKTVLLTDFVQAVFN
jgi:hypothetical protein